MNVSRPQPEEIESYIHERSWDQIKGLDWLYGAWVWQMFDAASEVRSEEHTSELQSLMRISYAVFCLKKKKERRLKTTSTRTTREKNIHNTKQKQNKERER